MLACRALEDDVFDEYTVPAGSDIFISVWNLHRSPQLWPEPNAFNPDRFPVDGPIPNEVRSNAEEAWQPTAAARKPGAAKAVSSSSEAVNAAASRHRSSLHRSSM
jgi:cytochrome P450